MNKVEMKKYKLKDIGKIVTGKTPSTSNQHYFNGAIPFITPEDIAKGYCVIDTARHISIDGYNSIKSNTLDSFSILVGCIGSDMGNVAFSNQKCATNQQINAITDINEQIDGMYLYYLLSTKKEQFKQLAGSTTTPILPKSVFETIEYNIPPLPIQRKIAAVLTALDDKIALNKRINDKLEAMAKRLYDYWFVQFDFPDEKGRPYKSSGGKMVWNETLKREIPEGWEVKSIEEILDEFPSTKRYNTSEYLTEGQFPIIDQDSSAFIAGYTNDDSGLLKRFPAVLFGDHSTCVKFLNFEYCRGADGTQILYSNDHRINQYYLYLTIKEMNIPNPGYSRHFKYLKELPIIIPDLKSSDRYERIVKSFYEKKTNCDYEIVRLTSLRDRLLPLLMNGQVVVEGEF